jgi:hypothetical protein
MRASLLANVLLAVMPAVGVTQARVPAPSSDRAAATTIGFEVDALPYLTGGYYGSAWFGRNRIRARGVVTRATIPSFLVEDGFRNADIHVYAFIVDYCFDPGFRGPWVGIGLEYWKNSIENRVNAATAGWDNTIATLGAGYVWGLGGHFYVNPWAAGHLIAAGTTAIPVGGAVYHPKRLTPEASLKLGWHF